jgi:hypothetical protein
LIARRPDDMLFLGPENGSGETAQPPMNHMIASIVIIAFSLVLFVYWFRYTCLLILSTKTTRDYAGQVAVANQLNFVDIQSELESGPAPAQYNSLVRSLDRDFRMLTYLLRHAGDLQVGGCAVEQHMLMIDYRIMKVWYSLTRSVSNSQARAALEEMSQIVAHFANAVGERVAVGSHS